MAEMLTPKNIRDLIELNKRAKGVVSVKFSERSELDTIPSPSRYSVTISASDGFIVKQFHNDDAGKVIEQAMEYIHVQFPQSPS